MNVTANDIIIATKNHLKITYTLISSYLHRASIVSKILFIVQTDAHYYKIIEMLKQVTNLKL
jgi:hypothetical protein